MNIGSTSGQGSAGVVYANTQTPLPYESAVCLESIGAVLDQMEQRLQPILKQLLPVPQSNNKSEVQMDSDLVIALRKIVNRLDTLNQRIHI